MVVINLCHCWLDPANEDVVYEAAVDVVQLVKLEDVMATLNLGPNGALVYCMEFLERNADWLLEQVAHYKDHYLLFDFPGQVSTDAGQPLFK